VSTLVNRALFAIIAAVAALGGFWVASELHRVPATEMAAPSEVAVDFALPDLHGYSRQLSEWRGKVILLNFWATWCAPCREEIPLLKQAQQQYTAQGLQVIGVAVDTEEAVTAYDRDIRFNYPVLIGEIEAINLLAPYGNRSGGLPFSVLIDGNGRIAHRKAGAYKPEELKTLLTTHFSARPAN
jgi:thiol-disulfide isomerase/thioredoxin